MQTRELLHISNSGHQGFNSLFAKAHSADWDYERDLDWTTPVDPKDSLVDFEWTAFGRTPTFQSLPDEVKAYVNRRGLGRILNILQVGESVAQNVCAKLVLSCKREEFRNHAAAQAMDEARHHLAYRRFLEKMNEEPEDIDMGSEMMFDMVLRMENPLDLVATEQFFLESFAMTIFEGIEQHATNPLLKKILHLITRDESRHMGFGILYLEDWLSHQPLDERIRFAGRWLPQIVESVCDKPGPILLSRVVQRLRELGVDNVEALAVQMLNEQRKLNEIDVARMVSGETVPQLLKSARRAGLLAPELLEAFGYDSHPVVRGALKASEN